MFLCGVCGERALPLQGDPSLRPRDLKRQAERERPYDLGRAFLYPFRAHGLYLFLAILLTLPFVTLLSASGGLRAGVIVGGFWSLIIGLQFKIVRSTSDGDNELPDWPEYMDWRERLGDILVYLLASTWQVAPLVVFVLVWPRGALRPDPLPAYWLAFASLWWISAAVFAMAFGAAGIHGGSQALRLDRHLRGFLLAGADGVTIANVLFGGAAALFLIQLALAGVPVAGAAAAGAIGAYWTLVSAHLVGVLFRRHARALEQVYL